MRLIAFIDMLCGIIDYDVHLQGNVAIESSSLIFLFGRCKIRRLDLIATCFMRMYYYFSYVILT